MNPLTLSHHRNYAFQNQVKERSDRLMNYFIPAHFLVGLLLALYYDTWTIAFGVGGLCVVAYYSVKALLPDSDLYQYVLSAVLGLYMAQFIYQTHGMFQDTFFCIYQQRPTHHLSKVETANTAYCIVVVIHHATLGYLQNIGYKQVYFTQLD